MVVVSLLDEVSWRERLGPGLGVGFEGGLVADGEGVCVGVCDCD